MSVPEQIRVRLSRWCAERVPDADRERRQIGYTTVGDRITIVDRRPPAFPELAAAWTSTPIAQLRDDSPEPARWSLHLPTVADESHRWKRTGPPAEDPIGLLAAVEATIRAGRPPRTGPGSQAPA
jgi:hypothetical protein